jgi:triacylglycerol lipase
MNISELTQIQKAYTFAKISKFAYDDNPKFFGFISKKIEVENHVAFVLYNKTDIVVVCRGTELDDIKDIITDAEAFLVDSLTGTGKGHFGFEKAVKSVWDKVYLVINSIDNRLNTQRIWFTGHSLGGAMSNLMAALYQNKNPDKKVILFTFGCPRTGNKANTSLNAFKHHRYVDSADIVPRIPIYPFYHHGTLHYIDIHGKEIKPNIYTLIKDRIKCFFANPTNLIEKHMIDQYLDVLNLLEEE